MHTDPSNTLGKGDLCDLPDGSDSLPSDCSWSGALTLPKRRRKELDGKIFQINLVAGEVVADQHYTLDASVRTELLIIHGHASGTSTLRAPALQPGRSLQSVQATGAIEPILSLTSPAVHLMNLTFDGDRRSPAVSITAGMVTIEDCNFISSPAALQISGTAQVTIIRGLFTANHADGGKGAALRMSGGTISLTGTTFTHNHAQEGSAMYVTGALTRVHIRDVLFESNNASKGTLVVAKGLVHLSGDTRFVGNTAAVAKSIERLDGTVVYSLPVRLAHWIPSVFECKVYRVPCPPDSTSCDPDTQKELDEQPCKYELQSELLNRYVSYLSVGSVSEDFPFPCSSGLYGESQSVAAQSTPQCSGLCPAGRKCARATAIPSICEEGTFCELGSSLATPCPAATYGQGTGLKSKAQCKTCPAGYFCPAGTAASDLPQLSCPAGSKCPAGSQASIECEASTYQDKPGQATCLLCPIGSFCPVGTSDPTPYGYVRRLNHFSAAFCTRPSCALRLRPQLCSRAVRGTSNWRRFPRVLAGAIEAAMATARACPTSGSAPFVQQASTAQQAPITAP